MVTVGVVSLARVTFDLAEAARQAEAAWEALAATGATLVGTRELATDLASVDVAIAHLALDPPDAVVLLQATFTDATMAVRLHERLDLPLTCWSFPEPRTGGPLRLNSLCGANLAAYSLRRRASNAAFVHVDPHDCDAGDRVRAAIVESAQALTFDWPPTEPPNETPMAAGGAAFDVGHQWLASTIQRVGRAVAGAPIGVIGDFPDGFEPCDFDAAEVDRLVGATVDRVELADLFAAAEAVAPDELRSIDERIERDLELSPAVREQGVVRTERLYGGLHHLAAERGWKAVATRCWPECSRDFGGAACAAQAMLTADGVPAMCEADVYGALTALILRTIAGADPFVADVVDADRSDGTSAVWHCGQASIRLAEPGGTRRGIVHPMQGRALLHEFALRPGRVTIARLSQARGRPAMVIGGGEMLRRPRPFAGTCGVLRWDLPIDDVLQTIFGTGLEHHVAIVAGDHRDVLVALAAQWGIPVLRLGHDHGRRRPALVATDVLP